MIYEGIVIVVKVYPTTWLKSRIPSFRYDSYLVLSFYLITNSQPAAGAWLTFMW